jgi:hypothetical protein
MMSLQIYDLQRSVLTIFYEKRLDVSRQHYLYAVLWTLINLYELFEAKTKQECITATNI